MRRFALIAVAAVAVLASAASAPAQTGTTAYRLAESWAKLPGGRAMPAVGKLVTAPDGNSIWAVVRCIAPNEPPLRAPKATAPGYGAECVDSKLDTVFQFDLEGHVIKSFGGGLFIWPHGMGIDPDGNIWVTDAAQSRNIPAGDKRGHQVIKFSPDGRVLARIGTGGQAGGGRDHLTSPSDIAFAQNGDALIADGHYADGNNRVVRFSSSGAYVSEFGKTGYGPGEFRAIHAIATDAAGRVYAGDRGNNRIQIFRPDGSYVTSWGQFGRPSGIFIAGESIYVADSESDNVENPGFEMGIRIGEIANGWVHDFIPYMWGDPRIVLGTGAEFVTVDRQGNIYGGEPVPRNIQKYVRVRP